MVYRPDRFVSFGGTNVSTMLGGRYGILNEPGLEGGMTFKDYFKKECTPDPLQVA